MAGVFVVFANQLVGGGPPGGLGRVVLAEHPRHFSDFKFHKKKLVFHRAGLKYYERKLGRKRDVVYLEHGEVSREGLGRCLGRRGVKRASMYDPVDYGLEERLRRELKAEGIECEFVESPLFLCDREYLREHFGEQRHYSMNSFYTEQRRRLGVLMEDGRPAGGQWSFDKENRRPMRGEVEAPGVKPVRRNEYVREAEGYVNRHFGGNPGEAEGLIYPVTHAGARGWLADFVERRLELFGPYEDAISAEEPFLFHSVLSCLLNCGLLRVEEVLEAVLERGREGVRLNSVEGFVRQIIGWREFMRAVYALEGRRQAEANFWGCKQELPYAFCEAATGVEPVDVVIRRVMERAYAHHIERLMILGNFMLLCEIRPQEVYRWFMELFIDAYDWVMTPNVYGMSQYADGGRMTTKPYVSSSNYVRKMSDFGGGEWCEVWDGLFWRFVERHKKVFAGNARMKVMAVQLERMDREKRRGHVRTAERYLEGLFG